MYSVAESLKTKLESLGSTLSSFSVQQISDVVAALNVLRERGMDRTRDALINCDFSSYVGITAQSASYAREFQRAANEVATKDLNTDTQVQMRFGADYNRLVASWENDVHPDQDFSDMENELPDDGVVDYYLETVE